MGEIEQKVKCIDCNWLAITSIGDTTIFFCGNGKLTKPIDDIEKEITCKLYSKQLNISKYKEILDILEKSKEVIK